MGFHRAWLNNLVWFASSARTLVASLVELELIAAACVAVSASARPARIAIRFMPRILVRARRGVNEPGVDEVTTLKATVRDTP
jgi:hypothetical protein